MGPTAATETATGMGGCLGAAPGVPPGPPALAWVAIPPFFWQPDAASASTATAQTRIGNRFRGVVLIVKPACVAAENARAAARADQEKRPVHGVGISPAVPMGRGAGAPGQPILRHWASEVAGDLRAYCLAPTGIPTKAITAKPPFLTSAEPLAPESFRKSESAMVSRLKPYRPSMPTMAEPTSKLKPAPNVRPKSKLFIASPMSNEPEKPPSDASAFALVLKLKVGPPKI